MAVLNPLPGPLEHKFHENTYPVSIHKIEVFVPCATKIL